MKLALITKLIVLTIFFSACSSDTWTEGYSLGGFERTYETYINFENGGRVLFTANASSELFKDFENEVTIEIKFNGKSCDKASNTNFSNELLVSAKCEFELEPGRQDFEVFVYSRDANEMKLTVQEGWGAHTIHGKITMTKYK